MQNPLFPEIMQNFSDITWILSGISRQIPYGIPIFFRWPVSDEVKNRSCLYPFLCQPLNLLVCSFYPAGEFLKDHERGVATLLHQTMESIGIDHSDLAVFHYPDGGSPGLVDQGGHLPKNTALAPTR